MYPSFVWWHNDQLNLVHLSTQSCKKLSVRWQAFQLKKGEKEPTVVPRENEKGSCSQSAPRSHTLFHRKVYYANSKSSEIMIDTLV
jgi:hypothetical protein